MHGQDVVIEGSNNNNNNDDNDNDSTIISLLEMCKKGNRFRRVRNTIVYHRQQPYL